MKIIYLFIETLIKKNIYHYLGGTIEMDRLTNMYEIK